MDLLRSCISDFFQWNFYHKRWITFRGFTLFPCSMLLCSVKLILFDCLVQHPVKIFTSSACDLNTVYIVLIFSISLCSAHFSCETNRIYLISALSHAEIHITNIVHIPAAEYIIFYIVAMMVSASRFNIFCECNRISPPNKKKL